MEKPTGQSLRISETETIYYPIDQIGEFWIFRLNNFIGIRYNIVSKLIEFYNYSGESQVNFYDGYKVGGFTIPEDSYIHLVCNMYISGYNLFRKTARRSIFKRGIISIIIAQLLAYAVGCGITSCIIGLLFGFGLIFYLGIKFEPNAINCKHIVQVIEKFCNEKFKETKETSQGSGD